MSKVILILDKFFLKFKGGEGVGGSNWTLPSKSPALLGLSMSAVLLIGWCKDWKGVRKLMVEIGAAEVWRIRILFSKKIFKVIVQALCSFSLRATFDFCQRYTFPVADFQVRGLRLSTWSFLILSGFSLTYFSISWYIESKLSLACSRRCFVYLVDLMQFLAAALVNSSLGLWMFYCC